MANEYRGGVRVVPIFDQTGGYTADTYSNGVEQADLDGYIFESFQLHAIFGAGQTGFDWDIQDRNEFDPGQYFSRLNFDGTTIGFNIPSSLTGRNHFILGMGAATMARPIRIVGNFRIRVRPNAAAGTSTKFRMWGWFVPAPKRGVGVG